MALLGLRVDRVGPGSVERRPRRGSLSTTVPSATSHTRRRLAEDDPRFPVPAGGWRRPVRSRGGRAASRGRGPGRGAAAARGRTAGRRGVSTAVRGRPGYSRTRQSGAGVGEAADWAMAPAASRADVDGQRGGHDDEAMAAAQAAAGPWSGPVKRPAVTPEPPRAAVRGRPRSAPSGSARTGTIKEARRRTLTLYLRWRRPCRISATQGHRPGALYEPWPRRGSR